ncbi:hypothetical protein [Deinococcus arcticus]|uniref:Uncharacterized protein n=1 Tax=Deinococcus arcticus TaxID=2136176 RepID=A0A2T3W5M2_9DEIO|nr:hypothetical protein [Deinococcus arcticus]PTA67084.1 hypothetical protein C8263_14295 [Deinococcus arcticus]
MEPTLLLCALIALTSGLHFGRRFAQAHRTGGAYLLPALAHGVVCSPLVLLSTLLDPTGLLWMAVAAVALCGLAIGALRPMPAQARAQTLTLDREPHTDVQAA